VNADIVAASALVGLLVGMTGAGGGALMTPMLVLLFSIKPSSAISSDLLAAVLMRPFGAAVHLRQGTVNLALVGWMAAGSVPAAFFGAYLLHLFGGTRVAEHNVEIALGAALLLGSGAMVARSVLDQRGTDLRPRTAVNAVRTRPLATVGIGALGGLVVGMTSVGAGSLMIVLLMFCYPALEARQLVGTDLTQAVPLSASAALGALVFGHVVLPLTAAIIVGSVPAVLVGSWLSATVPDRWVRPVITAVISVSGLKYVGVSSTQLRWVVALVPVLVVGHWALSRRAMAVSRRAATSGIPIDEGLPARPGPQAPSAD